MMATRISSMGLSLSVTGGRCQQGHPDGDPAQVGPVSPQAPAHLFGPRGDVGQAQVVAAARAGDLTADDLPERLRVPAAVVRDAERDGPAAVAQPDDRVTGPSVDGRVED